MLRTILIIIIVLLLLEPCLPGRIARAGVTTRRADLA